MSSPVRALAYVGIGIMSVTLGACGALQGLDKYLEVECEGDCDDASAGGVDATAADTFVAVVDGAAPREDAATEAEAGCGDTSTDPNNCGACGKKCGQGFTCSAGNCTCAYTVCGADGGAPPADAGPQSVICVDTQTNPSHCGGCGVVCSVPNATAKCTQGACGVQTCAANFTDCNGLPNDGCECAADSCIVGAQQQKLCSKRVFVTSTMYDGNMGGLAGADAKCQARATAANLPGTYKAWLSDTTGSPSTRFTKSALPYRLIDGTLVANDYTDLTDGALAHAINVTELGGAPPLGNTSCAGGGFLTVWSETKTDGTFAAQNGNCTNWTSNATGGSDWGRADDPSLYWTSWCGGGTCSWLSPIYCFQQ